MIGMYSMMESSPDSGTDNVAPRLRGHGRHRDLGLAPQAIGHRRSATKMCIGSSWSRVAERTTSLRDSVDTDDTETRGSRPRLSDTVAPRRRCVSAHRGAGLRNGHRRSATPWTRTPPRPGARAPGYRTPSLRDEDAPRLIVEPGCGTDNVAPRLRGHGRHRDLGLTPQAIGHRHSATKDVHRFIVGNDSGTDTVALRRRCAPTLRGE